MPKIMLRLDKEGNLICYVAKKDLEGKVVALEFNEDHRWGGRLQLEDGSALHIDPLPVRPSLPMEVRARRAE
ncbi:MAG: putative nitrogen fixation protein NifT [Magnetococcales bacterium]|nr:putative nitrogen fixation protein NifT [Magnetococcales bacterium]MBF0149044.1 putative nitrogen fixation protein NifT [Magnetococcales bacterium]MBF0172093.1 putative nitrogen fixation protein NifT [Magnetococcales bacterium]MBF0632625.1 putative nitrogen fixation protein NifT [Magnetococcales bacterium]